jgi:hypothetical protein
MHCFFVILFWVHERLRKCAKLYGIIRLCTSFAVGGHGALKIQLKSVTELINFVVEAHDRAIITEIFAGPVALLADYLPNFSALYGTRSFITAFTSVCPGPWQMFLNIVRFYGEEWLTPRTSSQLKDSLLSAVRYCLSTLFAATLHYCRSFLYPPP